MERCFSSWRNRLTPGTFLLLLPFSASVAGWGEAPAAAVRGFNDYVGKVESRLAQQHRSPKDFVASFGSSAQTDTRLQRGDLIVEKLTPPNEAEMTSALLHHWRGTAFVRGATVVDFERLMKDFSRYPQRFSPQIVRAGILSQRDGGVPDHFAASMRVRQHHVITVVMDSAYDILYGRLDPQHGYSVSRSTRISEIASAGTPKEHPLSNGDEHGFLWRMNTYWSYEERDGGLYMQVESVSLTHSIPAGLGWMVRPYVESVPRESLEFTLRAVCNALRE
jgi:hypothetical protein